MVRAEANEPEALLAALKAGSYYSTQGPEIRSVEVTAEAVRVECSAAASIIVSGQGTASKAIHGESMTRGEMPMERFRRSPWLRVTVVDRAGRRAWANPFWR
jgi:hypothetical protein